MRRGGKNEWMMRGNALASFGVGGEERSEEGGEEGEEGSVWGGGGYEGKEGREGTVGSGWEVGDE